ncbi:DUF4136 domain-containing protein [Sphingomonas morindae]|uniref:DUF4136 domain-containing protein n=1 Tax=Sphingomonas morindae TaxID=1541170 RepID=A0ABY4XAK2_9SPHN|nr:DUF4136 domain-containing protein [Sphingomonas morindae]USI73996.1 DUF4136 domain-containing protein [Sphingomonas morindae]
MVPFRRAAPLASAAALALALAGCTTTPPVEVTRFHLADPIARGSFVVQQGVPAGQAVPPGLGADSLEQSSYNQIVAGALQRTGFTPAASIADADLVASVIVDRGTREDLSARQSGFSFGLGGFGGGGGYRHGGTAVGGGLGVTVPVGGNHPRYIIGTRLMVQLKRRSEGTVIWEGRAQTEARGADPASQPDAAVAKLANALFTGFPGESGRTITVK